jgi:hypothetical protein
MQWLKENWYIVWSLISVVAIVLIYRRFRTSVNRLVPRPLAWNPRIVVPLIIAVILISIFVNFVSR